MLRFEDVSKSYGANLVLSGIEFELGAGEILALCGENGAGKSTLMGILAGAIPHGQFEGRVIVDGAELRLGGPAEAERAGISLLPQELVYYPSLSVAENVMAACPPARAGALRWGALRRRARELCQVVGLDVPLSRPVSRLEPADQQLVCIARALALDPKVLILDEPTAALPAAAAERLFEVVREIAASGRSVVYISHHLSELPGFATKAAVLRNGRLAMAPRPMAGLGVKDLVRTMLGADLLEKEERRTATEPGVELLRMRVDSLLRGERVLLEDVELEVRAGEILGIAGLTGSGREELVRACAGVREGELKATITVGGRRLRRFSPQRARRNGLFYLPPDRRLEGILPLADIDRNTLLGSEGFGALAGLRRPAAERAGVDRACERTRVRVEDRRKQVGRLSGGNQQRVLLARGLLREGRVLLLSEPTRGVDVGARVAIHELIREFAGEGRGVVVASSDPAELAVLCSRVMVLRRGRLSQLLEAGEVSEPRVAAATAAQGLDKGDAAGTGTPSDATKTKEER